MSQQTVNINFLANATQANTAINALQRNLRGLQNSVGGSSTALGALVGGFRGMIGPMAAVGAAYVTLAQGARLFSDALKTNMDFESTMQRVKSVVQEDGGDVAANMEWLAHKAREVGRTTRFSAIEAAGGLEHLAKAGYSAREASDSLNGVLLMSQASNMGVAETAEKVADMMTAFGADASETTDYVDILAMTAAKSTTDMYELSEAFKYVGVAGAGMGMDFKQVAAALGTVAGAGVKASMAGTAIRGVLIQLADSSSAANKKLRALGLSAEDIRPGPLNQLDQIMKKLRDKGVDANTAYAIFGQRAGVAANVFTSFYDSLVKFNGVLDDSEGAAQRMADTMDDTLEASVMKMKNAWAELMLVMNESTSVMSGLRAIVDDIRKGILDLALAIQIMNEAVKNGELGEMLWAAFKLVNAQIGNDLYNSLRFALQAVVAHTIGMFNMLIDPMFWSGLHSVFMSVVYSFASAMSAVMASLINGAAPFLAPLLAGVLQVKNTLVGSAMIAGGTFYGFIERAMNYLRSEFSFVIVLWQMIPVIMRTLMTFMSTKLTEWVAGFGGMMSGFFSGMGQGIMAILMGMSSYVIQLTTGIRARFAGIIAMFVGSMTSLFAIIQPYLQKIGDFFVGITDRIVTAFQRFLDDAKMVVGFIGAVFKSKSDAVGKGAPSEGDKIAAQGREIMGGDAKAQAESLLSGLADSLTGASGIFAGKANEAGVIGLSEIAGSFDNNINDAMSEMARNFKSSDLFGEGKLKEELAAIVGRNLPGAKQPPEDEKDGKGSGAGGAGANAMGLGGGLAGSNRMATNLIMGRTINEVIAQVAQDQLDVMEDMLAETQKTNTKLDEIKKETGGTVSVFD